MSDKWYGTSDGPGVCLYRNGKEQTSRLGARIRWLRERSAASATATVQSNGGERDETRQRKTPSAASLRTDIDRE